jgi:1-acyl-sn-glycerol-3-phosphate acyltransferase
MRRTDETAVALPQPPEPRGVAPVVPAHARPSLPLRRLWWALAGLRSGERRAGVPPLAYHVPPGWAIAMGRDLLLARPRSFRADCALAVRALPRLPEVDGLEHIPAAGPLVLVTNHYQRRDLWIGWSGALLCHALWRVRPDLSCHFVVTDRLLLEGAELAGTRWLFARVARVWDFILAASPEAGGSSAERSRTRALLACLRKLRAASDGNVCLCLHPEGAAGSSRGLSLALPGSGRALAALADAGGWLVPAAVWEEPGGFLHARFGAAFRPTWPATAGTAALDQAVSAEAMGRVAALLPEALRGCYAGAARRHA